MEARRGGEREGKDGKRMKKCLGLEGSEKVQEKKESP